MHEKLEAHIEDIAALVALLQESHERTETSLSETLQRVTALHDGSVQIAKTMVQTTGTLTQASEDVTRATQTMTRAIRWFPWKLAGIMVIALTVMAFGTQVLWMQRYTTRHAAEVTALERYRALALALDRYVLETLYPTLSRAQQREMDAVYTETRVTSPGERRQ